MPDPAVFLDRDGTLIREVGYASRPEQIRILGGVAQALRDLAEAGYRLIVVTNQSGIARGYITEDDLERFHDALDRQLHLLGASVDAYYACPHHPDPAGRPRPDLAVECDCRKPKPGLILRAAEDFGIDLAASWTVGDTWRDVAAGQAAGTRTIKLPADAAHRAPRPDDVAPPTAEARGLADAADIILGREAPAERAMEALSPEESEPEETDEDDEPPPDLASTPEAETEPETAEPETEPEAAPEPAPERVVESLSPSGRGLGEAKTDEQPPEPSEPPPAEPRQCARCGGEVAPDDIARGAAAVRDGFLLCPECLAQQPREPGAGPDASVEDLLRLVLAELQRMRRAQRPSSLSLFRLLAYIVQAAALFFGFGMALLGDETDLYLRIALLLQLLVLALLLFERRS